VSSFRWSLAAVVAAYLIGAIPFGYLIGRARGVDIRRVGSGNIGATNVGRVLGFRFFVVVFVLDLLKGLLPTYEFPRVVAAMTGQGVPSLGVFVALASILGHNFPVYLSFRGGKGVATSLGSLLALDWVAALSAAGGFGISLLTTRYVSVSSLFGGVVFALVHFVRTPAPLGRKEVAMSVLTIGLLILLFFRHRKNLARLRAGTEPKVPRGKRKQPPEGKVAGMFMIAAAIASAPLVAVLVLATRANTRAELRVGSYTLAEVARVATGHQRAERLAFAAQGRLLAVTCPRYNRLVLYRITEGLHLEPVQDIALEGRPVALAAASDRVYVLERPAGDARHVEPGFWETFDLTGQPLGSRYRVGFYPDDLALTPDGRHALVLTSGRAEGDANKPLPALAVIALGPDAAAHRLLGKLELDPSDGDPDRLAISASGRWAQVQLAGKNQTLAVDVSAISRPLLAPTAPEETDMEQVRLTLPGFGACVVSTLPQESAIALSEAASSRVLGRLPVRGPMNLTPTRPIGLAHTDERGLIAVATRSGSVHLIAVRPARGQAPNSLAGADVYRR
jgi:glycerol-3-phosphate acyltransferase PlsY